jgi:hypothetical protein
MPITPLLSFSLALVISTNEVPLFGVSLDPLSKRQSLSLPPPTSPGFTFLDQSKGWLTSMLPYKTSLGPQTFPQENLPLPPVLLPSSVYSLHSPLAHKSFVLLDLCIGKHQTRRKPPKIFNSFPWKSL